MKPRKKGAIGGNSLRMVRRYFPNVTTVEDAEKPVIVEVTVADNKHSDVKSHVTCALAIACKRFFNADGVIIGLTTSWIIRGKVATRYSNAGTVSREITSFDRKAGFDAGHYLLTPTPKANRLGTIRSKNPARAGKGPFKKIGTGFRHYTRGVRTTLGHYPLPEVA